MQADESASETWRKEAQSFVEVELASVKPNGTKVIHNTSFGLDILIGGLKKDVEKYVEGVGKTQIWSHNSMILKDDSTLTDYVDDSHIEGKRPFKVKVFIK
ncbi:uncharacterized protein LOC101851868 isoform X2 [Aplysia californica]|nr:uncharacterized protein LOC101851868 isoform X2 [Aplysia californica]XP_035825854.1 uncharacterized protein LOC101851868 isoform X2 [Aplysia californica]